MINNIIFISSIVYFLIGQVAPYQIPNSPELIKKGINNKFVWQKDYNFQSDRRVIVNFDSNNCFDELFLINSKGHYSGPYNTKFVSKTNPFKAKDLTIQVSSSLSHCEIDDMNFTIEDYKENINRSYNSKIYSKERENPVILITGYWPPTNEMIRDFSQSFDLNPSGWIGDNWENRGYDVISFFPEFDDSDCTSCGQGYGDLEVDYQDTSEDFWPIVNDLNPMAVITFSRGYIDYSWELEYNYYNRLNWINDFMSPFLPTPNPPDDSVINYFIRHSSLPMESIVQDIIAENLGLDPYIDWDGHPGQYVSEFMGYHGVWYQNINQLGDNKCITAGHVHVGGLVDIETAKRATEVTLRSVINLLDESTYILGDINQDQIIDILDLVMIVNYILGIQDFESIQSYAADINEDAIINIQDIIAIINIILES